MTYLHAQSCSCIHAETPTAPDELTGTIQNISDDTIAQTGAKAVSFINWSMPENNMAIDYFDIILIGTHTNNTMSMRMTDQYSLQQMFSQKYVLSEGNYTSVSITAVDLCGKRSESIQVHLTNTTTASMCVSNLGTSDAQQQNSAAAITGAVLGVLLLICIIIIMVLALLAITCHHKDKLPSLKIRYTKRGDHIVTDVSH